MAQVHTSTPLDLNVHDPNFDRKMLAWAFHVQCEMRELVLITKETVAATKVLIAEADRILARNQAAKAIMGAR